MRATRWGLAAALAALAAGRAGATTVSVTITGLSNTAYELEVSGVRKSGRLSAVPGASTVRDLVDVGARGEVTATLTFLGDGGVLATCPRVRVKVDGARASCEPMFTLTDVQSGSARFVCKTTCDRTRLQKSSHDEDDDDDEDWVYAMTGTAPRPRLDGWSQGLGDTAKSQSVYSGSMCGDEGPLVYSAGGRGSL